MCISQILAAQSYDIMLFRLTFEQRQLVLSREHRKEREPFDELDQSLRAFVYDVHE